LADGHIIKCTTTRKIHITMLDDNGNKLDAVLVNVMYIPGLSQRLFSITKFGKLGHYAIIIGQCTTLYFGDNKLPMTLSPLHDSKKLASDSHILKIKKMRNIQRYVRPRSED
jgi:hypothetical protein